MPLRDIVLALLVIAIWAGNVIAIKLSVEELAPLTALALRFGLTALVFLPFVRGVSGVIWRKLAEIALLMGLAHQGLLFIAMTYLPAGITSILLQTQVIFAALIGIFIFHEQTGWRTWTGILLGIAGVAVMVGAGRQDTGPGFMTGFAVIILSTIALAFAYMRLKQLPPVRPATFLFGMNGLAFPPVLAASFAMAPQGWHALPDADWALLAAVFAFQIIPVGLSHILWQRLLARNPISLVTPFALLLPVLGVALAVTMLGESLTPEMAAGGLVTMTGVAIIVLRRGARNRKPAPPLSETSP